MKPPRTIFVHTGEHVHESSSSSDPTRRNVRSHRVCQMEAQAMNMQIHYHQKVIGMHFGPGVFSAMKPAMLSDQIIRFGLM